MENNLTKCSKCGSTNIKKKRSWSSVILWGALFVIALIVSQVSTDDRLSAGSSAIWFVLIIPIVVFAIMAMCGSNYCRDCNHRWS